METKIGNHYWATMDNKSLIVLKQGEDEFDVCGGWECSVSESEDNLKIISPIDRPEEIADLELYY